MSITTGLEQIQSAELSRIHANGPRGLRRPTAMSVRIAYLIVMLTGLPASTTTEWSASFVV